MKVFIAGATGVIGRPLTAQLVAADHEVFAMTRSDKRAAEMCAHGAMPVVCDVFDRDNLHRCVEDAQPDVVIHQLTALPKQRLSMVNRAFTTSWMTIPRQLPFGCRFMRKRWAPANLCRFHSG